MAKGYSARRGFTKGGVSVKQQAMQQQLYQMQQQMTKKQEEVEAMTFTSSVGGGAVVATANGKKELTELTIKPETVDPEEVELLQDLIKSAVNEALRQAEDTMNASMEAFQSGISSLGIDTSGF